MLQNTEIFSNKELFVAQRTTEYQVKERKKVLTIILSRHLFTLQATIFSKQRSTKNVCLSLRHTVSGPNHTNNFKKKSKKSALSDNLILSTTKNIIFHAAWRIYIGILNWRFFKIYLQLYNKAKQNKNMCVSSYILLEIRVGR